MLDPRAGAGNDPLRLIAAREAGVRSSFEAFRVRALYRKTAVRLQFLDRDGGLIGVRGQLRGERAHTPFASQLRGSRRESRIPFHDRLPHPWSFACAPQWHFVADAIAQRPPVFARAALDRPGDADEVCHHPAGGLALAVISLSTLNDRG